MKVAVVGAGAMGTLFGTTLVKAGHNVLFLDTYPRLLEHYKECPYAYLITEGRKEQIPVTVIPILDCPSEEFDLVIIFVKSAGTQAAMDLLDKKKVITDNTIVLTCQGGFENPEIIASKMSKPSHLIPGCTTSFSKAAGIMTIENFGIRKTTVWPHGLSVDEEPSERLKEIVHQADAAGLMIELTPRAITDRWKMLLYYPTNIAVSAILKVNFGDCWATPECRDLLIALAKECALIAKLEGIDQRYFNEQIAIEAVEGISTDTPTHAGSMLNDVKLKRVTEIDGTSGALLRIAKHYGVDLPYTKAIWAILRTIEHNYDNVV